jgi:hypothetical protein
MQTHKLYEHAHLVGMLRMLQRHTVHIFYAHLPHKRIRINVRTIGLEHCNIAGVDAVDLQREALLHVLHNAVNDVRMCTQKLSQCGAGLQIPCAYPRSANGGKPQQAAPVAVSTEHVEHRAAETSAVPSGLRSI